jgi:epoxide hydrolase-like predicted phosphatase
MGNSPAISAVLWDLGGVLLRTEDTSHREKWEQRFDLEPWGLEKLVFGNEVSRKASAGAASKGDIWDYVQIQLGLLDEEMDDFKREFFRGDEIDQELITFIRDLKQKLKSGMITNAWPGMRHYIEDVWKIGDAFDQIIVSAEVKMVKPDPGIYQLALDHLDVEPQASVFIDDFIENIQGAEDVGMIGIHFQSTDDVMTKLGDLLGIEH